VFGSNDAQMTLAADPDRVPAGLLLMILGELGFALSLGLLFTIVLLLFPTGRLLSRRWRPVAWTTGAALAALATGTVFQPGPMGLVFRGLCSEREHLPRVVLGKVPAAAMG
jgi:hypothetical protein